MCTVTWALGEGGFDLLANRDERRARGPATPPALGASRGVRYLAPTDSDAGGTWIAANEHGVCVTILNDDAGDPADAGRAFRSRGALVRELAHAESAEAVARALRDARGAELGRFRGFRLVALEPGAAEALHLAWDGRRLAESRVGPGDLPLVSSAYGDGNRIRRARRGAWEELVLDAGGPTPERLVAFHRSRRPAPGPEAVSMTREDAATVSASWVAVRADRVEFRYCPTAPSDGDFGEPAVLEVIPPR